jgi:hypothetical protein
VDDQLPAGQPLRMEVQQIDGFASLLEALRALARTPGIAGAQALRLSGRGGLFEVTLSAPATRESLVGAASAALGRAVRVEQA